MLTTENFDRMLDALGFTKTGDQYKKSYRPGINLEVDLAKQLLVYPESKGLKINDRNICNFARNENFVVFECVHRLLQKGYDPKHLELEPRWKVGHGASGGRADILVRDKQNQPLLLIECKTAGREFAKAWENTKKDGDQLFSYAQQIPNTQFLCLYASDLAGKEITHEQRIISHADNEEIAKQYKRTFASANNVESRFAVWRDIYLLESTESGIFEADVPAYEIGKKKYSLLHDTDEVQVADTQGKYNEFRTILRKHNVARRENAFEVLVNLFLCKIVDEENNPEDLKFRWKGRAYDDYFEFVDRLQNLYQKGMRKFLNEEISYISIQQINNAFWAVKGDRNATKAEIQRYFRELKFFTNSAFSFIDTHNARLFNTNAEVLVEVVQMWQNMRLKSDAQNQFLGDMFENFLDDGIKQSNGQFFTPLPICKLIVSALPLAEKINASEEPLRVIDYACGAGHFLTEYAHQIKTLLANNPQSKHPLQSYYDHILGVEKEYRLAKVAKVAAYMHGQGQIRILDVDALAEHEDLSANSFDVLVANPPFSVPGFLQTLSDKDKARYQLTETCGKFSDTDSIQCFFVERIQQLMAPCGVVGVIVPFNILSGSGAVYVRTREIILQFFEVVSIVVLSDKTFNKTDTKTVILFLRRRDKNPEVAEHYRNRVTDFMGGDTHENSTAYQDRHLVEEYCRHIGVPYADYQNLFVATDLAQIKGLLQHDVFRAYQREFALRAPKTALLKNDTGKDLIAHIQKIEQQKLLYFILATQQPNEVLLVNTPSESRAQKQFLGYTWVGRKGSEGIQYSGGETVHDISTPMFDPNDLAMVGKINTAIKNNFCGKPNPHLPPHCQLVKLQDLLDFSRTDFNKRISTSPQHKAAIESKWDLVRVGDFCELEEGSPALVGEPNYLEIGDVNPVSKKYDISAKEKLTVKGAVTVPANTFLISTVRPTRGAITITTEEVNVSSAFCRIKLRNKYLYLVLNQEVFFAYLGSCATGVSYPVCKTEDILNFKIPNPPAAIQKKIVTECEAVDKDVAGATLADAQLVIAQAAERKKKILQKYL